MTATPAQRSKTYHDKQRAKLARAEAMETALSRIVEMIDDHPASTPVFVVRKIAAKALATQSPWVRGTSRPATK